jgi:hypothetical protein
MPYLYRTLVMASARISGAAGRTLQFAYEVLIPKARWLRLGSFGALKGDPVVLAFSAWHYRSGSNWSGRRRR